MLYVLQYNLGTVPDIPYPVIDGDDTDTAVDVPNIATSLLASLPRLPQVPLNSPGKLLPPRAQQQRHRSTASVSTALIIPSRVVDAYRAFAVANTSNVRTKRIWICFMLNTPVMRATTTAVRGLSDSLDAKRLWRLL